MIDLPATVFPADEQFTSTFFATHEVRLSVELIELCNQSVVDARSDYPSFFFWEERGSLYLVDFVDGFSIPLADGLGVALNLIVASGVNLSGLCVHWRDETKIWHTLTPRQVIGCRFDSVYGPVAA